MSIDKNLVVLVNEQDQDLGTCEKMEAHEKGLLHRAISVFVFNDKGEWLLQRRAATKYHCGGMWSNTCCSHPFFGETPHEAANRRLMEEMGMSTSLHFQFPFLYKAQVNNDLIEHELDHVFIGYSNDIPVLNLEEVDQFKYVSSEELSHQMSTNGDQFTPWFRMLHEKLKDVLETKKIAS